MTEAEWLACDNPAAMFLWMRKPRGPFHGLTTGDPRLPNVEVSERKMRLFAAACHPGVEEWEQLAEGTFVPLPRTVAFTADDGARISVGLKVGQCHPEHLSRDERAHRAALLRCICGNPWRPVVRPAGTLSGYPDGTYEMPGVPLPTLLNPAWLTPTVVNVARTIYEERNWAATGILADALEEAGCVGEVCPECGGLSYTIRVSGGDLVQKFSAPQDCRACHGTGRVPHPLIAHLRGPGPHARGCWAVDLLLGKS